MAPVGALRGVDLMAEKAKEVKKEEPRKPVYRARYGNCSGALWVNETGKGKMLSATFQKYYKDAQGNDKNTGSFGVNDLQKLRLCVEDVFREIVVNGRKYTEEPGNEGDV
ncbi:hypothetical protein DRN67_04160 [Candidatus Micrarchaeota archaeon]|nr:MAG: hypothetical protein DRN67_04160 [Candidatus Micrarchaeota archaeon]